MFLINAFKIIFLLGFLIFIHEGGHFLAAKLFTVRVEQFSIGFGPKIYSKQGKETLYSFSLIPFGGYVKMTGEEERSDEEGAFNKAKVWQRIIIVAAGAIVNILFAIIVYFILTFSSGYNISTTVAEIIPEAQENLASSIQVGDKILEVNDEKIRTKLDITKAIQFSNGEEVKVLVERNNEQLEFYVKPTYYEEGYYLGIRVALLENVSFSDKIYYSFWESVNFLESMGESLKMLFTGKVGLNQMSGPVGISEIVVKTSGLYNFIYLLCLVSFITNSSIGWWKNCIIDYRRNKRKSTKARNRIRNTIIRLYIINFIIIICNM